MYLPLSLTITAAAILWATYGFLTSDMFVAAPQSVGFLAGVAQLLLFFRSEYEARMALPFRGGGGGIVGISIIQRMSSASVQHCRTLKRVERKSIFS